MDPLSAWNVGSRAVTGGTNSFYAIKDVSSILVPGTVVLAELWYLLSVSGGISSSSNLANALAGLSTLQAIMTSLLVLASAYVIGYPSRQVAFLILGLSTVKGSVGDILNEVGRLDRTAVEEAKEKSTAEQATGLLADIERLHPVLAAARAGGGQPGEGDAASRPDSSLLFGGHARSRGSATDYAVFSYCKLWLRAQAPRLSIDHVEIEINVLAGCLTPTALIGVIMLVAPGEAPTYVRIVVCVAVTLSLWLLVKAAVNLRQRERVEAVRNVCFDYMMRKSAESLSNVGRLGDAATSES